jgi:imidazolonepropionase-like amidohydrolase
VTAWHLRGRVLPDDVERDVWVVEGRLAFEPGAAAEGATTVAADVWLLPGLVDVHAHLSLASPLPHAPPEERVRASAQQHRDAGVLAIREPGSPDHASTGLGPAEGLPRVVTAGRFLAPPGRYFPGLAREVHDDALPEAALEELRVSGAWVKLIGDSSLPGPGVTPTYGRDAVTETVRRVHDAGGRVAVHCALPEVVQLGIEAGVDSLEHGSFIRADQVGALAASGAVLVPTLSINEAIRGLIPDASALDGQPEALCAAVDAGVPILAGTDAGMGPHGLVRREVALLREAGIGPIDALAAASWAARRFLGLPVIEEGAPADLTAYAVDPREDLGALAAPTTVFLDGRLVHGARSR